MKVSQWLPDMHKIFFIPTRTFSIFFHHYTRLIVCPQCPACHSVHIFVSHRFFTLNSFYLLKNFKFLDISGMLLSSILMTSSLLLTLLPRKICTFEKCVSLLQHSDFYPHFAVLYDNSILTVLSLIISFFFILQAFMKITLVVYISEIDCQVNSEMIGCMPG